MSRSPEIEDLAARHEMRVATAKPMPLRNGAGRFATRIFQIIVFRSGKGTALFRMFWRNFGNALSGMQFKGRLPEIPDARQSLVISRAARQ